MNENQIGIAAARAITTVMQPSFRDVEEKALAGLDRFDQSSALRAFVETTRSEIDRLSSLVGILQMQVSALEHKNQNTKEA